MTGDDYPAVRHLAARALGRLLPPALPALAAYDSTAPEAERRRVAERIRRAVPAGALDPPDAVAARRLRAAARGVAIEIGE